MAVETELKLRVEPRHLARLRQHPLLKGAAHTAPRKLYSIYYDTPQLELWRAGVALRLRREGSRWVQTVKGGGSAAGGVHRRNEAEAAIAAPSPDVTAITDAALAAHFASPRLRARLRPVIVTEFTRASWMLTAAQGVKIEASIDRGTIKSGDAIEAICELELEVKAGPPWRACQVALQLLETVPLIAEDRSKAERGFELRRGVALTPHKSGPSPLRPEMTCNDAFKALAHSCLAQFVANQRGMLGTDDPEYLHQMRVALRRLRSVFTTFAPLFPDYALAQPVAETRWLATALGPARDWDVFAAETLPPVTARYTTHAGIAVLSRSALRLRRAANRAARRAVASARGQGFLLALGGWLSAETWLTVMNGAPASSKQGSRVRDANVREPGAAPSRAGVASVSGVTSHKQTRRTAMQRRPGQSDPDGAHEPGVDAPITGSTELARPVSDFARAVLAASHQRALKRGKHFSRLAPPDLHRLRLAAKKLRYATEFFAPLYDKRHARDYRAALARLQEGLGTYNDAVTVTRLAGRACLGMRGASAREAHGIMLGWSAGTQDAGTRHLKRVWKEFRAAKPFWE